MLNSTSKKMDGIKEHCPYKKMCMTKMAKLIEEKHETGLLLFLSGSEWLN